MFRKILLSAVLIAASSAATAGPITFSEGFDDVGTLAASGWLTPNYSTAGGETGWFQGNPGIFTSDSGADDSYIAANFLGAPLGGNIDNWLITPLFHVSEGSTISFATRTNGEFPDTLELLWSLGGADVADFMSIDTLAGADFPIDWTSVGLLAHGLHQNIRLAFRYLVTDTSANGDYIGIDSFEVRAVPEPGTIALFGAAFLMMAFAVRRRRDQI